MNKISISKIDEAIKNNNTKTKTVTWCGLDIDVRKHIPLTEVSEIVNDVVSAAFDKDKVYSPEFAFSKLYIDVLRHYTNLSMPSNEEHAYDIAFSAELNNLVISVIDSLQFTHIVNSINKRIEHINNMNESEVMRRVDEASTTLQNLVGQINEMYSGITKDDLNNMIKSIGEHGLDEKKIVSAYLEQKK